MNILDAIRYRIQKFLGVEHLANNPNNDTGFAYVQDKDSEIVQQIQEYRTWYYGDSNDLLAFYTQFTKQGVYANPIFNRNRANYYWSIGSTENKIKRVHSGIPNAIVSTLVNIVGTPKITSANAEEDIILQDILRENDFYNFLNQQQLPMTLVEGWGAIKIAFDTSIGKTPFLEYYTAENVNFVYKHNKLVGIIYRDFYEHNRKKYVLFETRRVLNGDSLIEYQLYQLRQDGTLIEAKFDDVPDLKGFDNTAKVIKGLNEILGVPSKLFFDMKNVNYGRSIFTGKIDNFDELDLTLSQKSKTTQVSTPVEYVPSDLLERDKNGNARPLPSYNREFIKYNSVPNGEGVSNTEITTTQPELNFDKYDQSYQSILNVILTGILSPATLGIDVAKKDNAAAQREKEKITIITRNNIIDRQISIIKKVVKLMLNVKEYLETGVISLSSKSDISVKYDEFANPSFEEKLQILGQARANGDISTEMYIDLLWGDSLSDEEKAREIASVEKSNNRDNLFANEIDDNVLNNELANNYQEKETV